MRPLKLCALAITILALSPAATLAETLSSTRPEALGSALEPQNGEIVLSLDNAMAIALSRNLDLAIGRFDMARADVGLFTNLSIFDPNLDASLGTNGSESPQITTIDSSERESQTFSVGISQLLPTGATVAVNTSTTRQESNSTFTLLNPAWNTGLTFSLTQPLLRNFGTFATRADYLVARLGREQTEASFRERISDTLLQVENAYWNLVAAREGVKVQERAVELAEVNYDETAERIRVGTIAQIELIQSRATIATRQQDLINGRNQASEAEDVLKQLLGFTEVDEWNAHLVTVDKLEAKNLKLSLAEALDTALSTRPLLKASRLAIEATELRIKKARNLRLPQLDLVTSYGYGGVGGNLTTLDENGNVVVVPGGFSDSASQITDFDFPNWNLQLNLRMPIFNNAGKANLAQTRWDLEQRKVELKRSEQAVAVEVRRAVRGVEDGAAAFEAAMVSSEAALENVKAEQTKLQNGLTTNYQVLELQDRLAQAKLSELRAQVSYLNAEASYQRSIGRIAAQHDILIEDPENKDDLPYAWLRQVDWFEFVDLDEMGFGK